MKIPKKLIYRKIANGEWVKPIMKGHKIQCCNCFAVHKFDFEILKSNKRIRYRLQRIR